MRVGDFISLTQPEIRKERSNRKKGITKKGEVGAKVSNNSVAHEEAALNFIAKVKQVNQAETAAKPFPPKSQGKRSKKKAPAAEATETAEGTLAAASEAPQGSARVARARNRARAQTTAEGAASRGTPADPGEVRSESQEAPDTATEGPRGSARTARARTNAPAEPAVEDAAVNTGEDDAAPTTGNKKWRLTHKAAERKAKKAERRPG